MTKTAQTLPAHFRRVRLERAREPGLPQGDGAIHYTLVAPIDGEGHLDAEAWADHRDACRVVRVRPGEESAEGRLRRRPGGSWAFHYEDEAGEDDDPGYRFDRHAFIPGEYVTIEEDEGAHTYRIVSVLPL